MNQHIPNIEDQLDQLLGILEMNINSCKILLSYVNDNWGDKETLKYRIILSSPIGNYLSLIYNNHFSESVSILTTLLNEKNNKEISFRNISIVLTSEAIKELNLIRNEFNSGHFLKFRHNIGDHKNRKFIDNPMYLNIGFETERFEKIGFEAEQFEKLKTIFNKVFTFSKSNLELTTLSSVNNSKKGLKDLLSQIILKDITGKRLEIKT